MLLTFARIPATQAQALNWLTDLKSHVGPNHYAEWKLHKGNIVVTGAFRKTQDSKLH
jgi:hypothetical protein